jgi:hypothetical protein
VARFPFPTGGTPAESNLYLGHRAAMSADHQTLAASTVTDKGSVIAFWSNLDATVRKAQAARQDPTR